MNCIAFGAFEPAQILAIAAAPHDAEPRGKLRIPRKMLAAALELFDADDEGNHEEHDVGLGDREIVQHPGVGHFDPGFPIDVAAGIDPIHGHIIRRIALRFVAEGDHLAVHRIYLRVCSEREAAQLAVESPIVVQSLQRVRIQQHGRTVFLERIKFSGMKHYMRVAGATAQCRDFRQVRRAIAIGSEQCRARLRLRLEPLGLHKAGFQIDVAVGETEHCHVTVTIQGNVVIDTRRILEVRSDAI